MVDVNVIKSHDVLKKCVMETENDKITHIKMDTAQTE